jgi:hypothetical protein
VTQGNEWPHTGGQPGGANQNHAAGGISTVSSLSDPANNLLYAALDLAAEGWLSSRASGGAMTPSGHSRSTGTMVPLATPPDHRLVDPLAAGNDRRPGARIVDRGRF